MKKRLINLRAFLMLLVLSFATGAWAEDDAITLSSGTYSGSGTTGQIVWTGTSCEITQTKGSSSSSTNVSSSYVAAPRWYASHVISFAAKSGYSITGATIVCTESKYEKLSTATYSTGASAKADGTTVTITSSGDFTITMGAQARISSITVHYTANSSVKAPAFSVSAGTYLTAQSVELSSETEGASIYYTLDGTTPTTSSTQYTSAISITETTTVNAIAVKDGESSAVATATYTIVSTVGDGTQDNPFTVADVITLNNKFSGIYWVKGVVVNGSAVAISSSNETGITEATNSNLVLSADGTSVAANVPVELPTGELRTTYNISDNSSVIGKELSVYGNLEAYFGRPGVKGTSQIVASEVIAENAAKPTITYTNKVCDGYFDGNTDVTLSCETEGATIKYYLSSTTEVDPDASMTEYSKVISLFQSSSKTNVIAYAEKDGVKSGTVVFALSPAKRYDSIADLIAADITSGTGIVVSFQNAPIKSIYVNNNSVRSGFYLDYQKGDNDILVYSKDFPEEWVAGGTISGSLVGEWKLYNGTWEIIPSSNTAWPAISYTAPAEENVLTSIAISGTPTKIAYYAGDKFEASGLVVTGTYSDNSTSVITEGIEWTCDPETMTLGTTSVDVLAGVGSVVSDVYKVNVTVTKAPYETVTYEFSSFTSGQDVTLTDLEGFTITLSKGTGSTNPAWNATAKEARIYANGSLTIKANNAIIQSIEYEYTVNANSKGNAPTIDGVEGKTAAGTWDVENKTWTGADSEVIFSTSGTAGNIGFTKLIIRYVEGSKTDTSLAWSSEAAEVTIGAEDNVFPTLTTTPANLEGVTYASSNTAVATIAEDGTITLVRAGETVITASYAGNDQYAEATPASYTLTVNAAPFVPTPAAEGYETVDFATFYSSVTTSETVADYTGTSFAMAFAKPESSTTPTKYYSSGKSVRAYKDNTITITAAEEILAVNFNWTKEKGEDTGVAITGIGTKTAVVTFSKTCSFDKITVSYKTVERASATDKYGTICAPYAFFADGATIYSAEMNAANTYVVLTEVDEIVAGTPYIYQATANKQVFAAKSASVEAPVDAAPLTGVFAATKLAAGDLVMQTKDGAQKFYTVAEGSEPTLSANKAYIKAADAAGVKALSIGFDETDGINAINALVNGDAKIYDINGRQLQTLQKGINIVNGVKVLVK